MKKDNNQRLHKCGALLLNSDWILTTKFCIEQHSDMDLGVASGFSLNEIRQNGRIPISYIVYYDSENESHDIVLVRLRDSIKRKSLTNVCLLANDNEIRNGAQTLSWGWGSTLSSEISEEIIHHSIMRYWFHYSNSIEMKQMSAEIVEKPSSDFGFATNNYFWIQSKSNSSMPCQGDFGNPVHLYKNGKQKTTLKKVIHGILIN